MPFYFLEIYDQSILVVSMEWLGGMLFLIVLICTPCVLTQLPALVAELLYLNLYFGANAPAFRFFISPFCLWLLDPLAVFCHFDDTFLSA